MPFPRCQGQGLMFSCLARAQETIGEVTQLHVENVDVHPYHHHTQPYQIVALDNDTAAMDGSWRVRCAHNAHRNEASPLSFLALLLQA